MTVKKKVVINGCYGGFGLSREAERRLVGCPHSELMEPSKYYGAREGWEATFEADQSPSSMRGIITHEGRIVVDNHSDDTARACPQLVKVVEEMGEMANGRCAKLCIVEIPEGVEYEVSEYDGNEHIAETHRTWG